MAGSGSEWKLSQLNRTAWQIEDGLPHNYVTSIATDSDGYLLLGTQAGLARFDGARFTALDKLSGTWVYSLLKASDSALWVGGYQSGLHVFRNGERQSWRAHDGIADDTVYSLLEDRGKRIWMVSPEGLLRFDHGHPKIIVRGRNVDGYAWQSMTEDDRGTVWFAAEEGLYRVNGNQVQALRLNGVQGLPVTSYYSSGKRQLYLGTTSGLYLLDCPSESCIGRSVRGVRGPVVGLRMTSDGALWAATWGNGLYRVDGSNIEQLSTREGFADDFVRVLSEDGEHNLWAGTRSGGLTRFRRTALKPFGIPEGLKGNYASAVTGDGADGLWLGTWRGGLFHWHDGTVRQQPLPEPALGLLINSLAVDGRNDLWVGSFHKLWRLRKGHKTAGPIALPGGDGNVTHLLSSRDGTLWMSKQGSGLMAFASGDPGTSTPRTFLPEASLTGLLEDSNGLIWIGAKSGLWRIAAPPGRELERLTQNAVTALALDSRSRVWVAGQGPTVRVYTTAAPVEIRLSGLPASPINLILTDAQGDIWFGGGRGLARAATADIEGFLAGHQARVEVANYGIPEGMRTIECRAGAQPSSWRTRDGGTWLPTAKGFVQIAPKPAEPREPPRPRIEKIQVDGKAIGPATNIQLTPGSHEVTFGFTAVRLSNAARLQFRYRLEGLDRDWVEAGTEQIARYGHLDPGSFQLYVSARDSTAPWSEPVASTSIQQLPFVYQMAWFRIGLACIAIIAIVALYRFRVRAVRRRYASVLEERNRIAREWHDTLLAGLSAASWQLDAAAGQCGQAQAAANIESARGMIRYCREEARRAISDLRAKPAAELGLAASLQHSVNQLAGGTAVRSRFEWSGKALLFGSEISSDILRICQEATANALQHAAASELVVRLEYLDGEISLSVQDDGVGIDAIVCSEPPRGHYGLIGMRERAERLGGKLFVSSAPGRGTTVRAVIPVPATKPPATR